MITSFGQYLLMAPSYINVLNVYAVRLLYSSLFFPIFVQSPSYSLPTYTTFPGVPKETTHLLLGLSHLALQLAKLAQIK